MPRIAEFAGILIYMYFQDHNPPHFHATYGGATALFAIADGSVVRGKLPGPQTKQVQEWTAKHRVELDDNWQRCMNGESPEWIDG